MTAIEDIIQPPIRESARRDLIVVCLLLGMFFYFVPQWFGAYQRSGFELKQVIALMLSGQDRFANQMLSHVLLMSLGMLLCLRYGVIDLSVWVVSAGGGLLASFLMQNGVAAMPALCVCIIAGMATGAFNGVLVCIVRIPSFIVTIFTAFLIMCALRFIFPGRQLVFSFDQVAVWFGWSGLTLYGYSALILTIGYAGTLAGMLYFRRHGAARWAVNKKRFIALCASGMLASMSGVHWLTIDLSAIVPHRIVDDLHAPAAVLLAGGLALCGRGRTMLSCVLLPISVAVAAAWKQNIMLDTIGIIPGVSISLFCLILGLVFVAVILRTAIAGKTASSRRAEKN